MLLVIKHGTLVLKIITIYLVSWRSLPFSTISIIIVVLLINIRARFGSFTYAAFLFCRFIFGGVVSWRAGSKPYLQIVCLLVT